VPISQRCRGARRRAAATVPPRARRRTRWRSRGTPGRSRRPRRATAGSARIPAAACGVTGLCAAAGWIPRTGVSVLAPSCDRLGLIAATPGDVAVAWTALGGTVGAPPNRVVTLSEEELGRIERERAAGARAAALRLSARLVEMPVPSLSSFGAPRAVDITAEAAAITPHAMRRRRPGAPGSSSAPRRTRPTSAPPARGSTCWHGHPRVGVLITPDPPQARLAGTTWAM
jgi:Amidase